jgi:phage/plasmid-associated DNA primase
MHNPRPGSSVPTSELHAAYERWCKAAGHPPLGIVAFGQEVYRRGYRTGIDIEAPQSARSQEDQRKGRVLDLRAWQDLKLTAEKGHAS